MNYAQFVSRYQWNPNDPTHLLGEGGFGKVYLAYDMVLDRQVALKMSAVRQARESLTLKHEVHLVTTQLPHDHKNIVKYESCHRLHMVLGEYDIAILQYYPEGNLAQLIAREQLTVAQKSNIAQQLLDGIAFYQAAGIIHRDLKPSNILIAKTPTGEYVPKIGDFGISKVFELDANTRITNTIKGGTLRFAAPEQLSGDKTGLNADLWSYGVLLYYLFLGELPIPLLDMSTNSYEALYLAYLQILKNWQLNDKVDKIPQPFQDWIKKCLVVNAEKRVKSVADLTNPKPQDNVLPLKPVNNKDAVMPPRKATVSTLVSETDAIPASKQKLYWFILMGSLLVGLVGGIKLVRRPSITPDIQNITPDIQNITPDIQKDTPTLSKPIITTDTISSKMTAILAEYQKKYQCYKPSEGMLRFYDPSSKKFGYVSESGGRMSKQFDGADDFKAGQARVFLKTEKKSKAAGNYFQIDKKGNCISGKGCLN